MDLQTIYQDTLKYATAKHQEKNQTVPGTNLPYNVHLCNVAMEIMIAGFNTPGFDTAFTVQVALLHDTLEDTATSFGELENKFGTETARAVSALTKNAELPKQEQMQDCLARIKKLQKEVWAVKLADRITNLQEPPSAWDIVRKVNYHAESKTIHDALVSANEYLAKRLAKKIIAYETFFTSKQVPSSHPLKKVLYIDMDNVLVDFPSGIARLDANTQTEYKDNYDDAPGIFALMEPVKDAVTSFNLLADTYDTYILSTAPWRNPSAWSDKLRWVQKHLGEKAYKRLIISHHKDMNKGHYLIDDREKNGAVNFDGELIRFGSAEFQDWQAVLKYLL
jgi:guanosine-3',5'-bis(diphosphate) 3'-pyrophosphohydrolase